MPCRYPAFLPTSWAARLSLDLDQPKGVRPDILAAVRAAARAPRTFSAAGLVEALNARREAPTHLLSPRETEVLRLLAQGQSIEHVARTLTMAPSTAKTHVGKIYEKLGVHNRAGAVMAGVKLGIVASGTAVTH